MNMWIKPTDDVIGLDIISRRRSARWTMLYIIVWIQIFSSMCKWTARRSWSCRSSSMARHRVLAFNSEIGQKNCQVCFLIIYVETFVNNNTSEYVLWNLTCIAAIMTIEIKRIIYSSFSFYGQYTSFIILISCAMISTC